MSTKFVGRRGSIGAAIEGTRGTYASPTYTEKHATITLDEQVDTVLDPAAFGSIEGAQDSHIVSKWVDATVEAPLKDTSLGMYLAALFGTDTPAAESSPNGAVYDHVFTVAQSNQHPSLSLAWNDPVQAYGFTNSMINSFEMSCEIGKLPFYKLNFMGIAGATQSVTPSYITENYFLPQYGTFKLASAVSGLAGASATTIKKIIIKVNKNLERDQVIGALAPADFLNKHIDVSVDVESYFQNEGDFKTAFLADTAKALLFDLQNTDKTIGSSAHPRLQMQVSKIKMTKLTRDLGINNIVKQSVSANGLYDTTTSSLLKFTLSNLVTAAYV